MIAALSLPHLLLADFGLSAALLSFCSALYAIPAALRKDARWLASARNAAIAPFVLLTLSVACLEGLLYSGAFGLEYVHAVTSRAMPWYLRLTALWGGQAGSLFFWCWLLSGYSALVMLRNWRRERDLQPSVTIVLMVTLLFFLGLVIALENPFNKLWVAPGGSVSAGILQPAGALPFAPDDGRGLNPLLRHPGMIIHPPMLYLGFIGFVVPYAFAIAALVAGRRDDAWIRVTRRWTLVAWMFLSLGLLLGGRWAYDVLGWGGYWGWDPVEIAAFMPWLTATAFLHSVLIQEKRGMFKHWNMSLIILTYALVVLGTFLTRSGVLSSVHAFAQSAIGPWFFAFVALLGSVSLGLLLKRWEMLRGDNALDSWLSREGLFLLNNLIFMGILAACLWGVMYPIISELFTGQKVTVGPPYYERTTGPLFAALLLLMGVAPLAAWRAGAARRLGRAFWKPALVAGLLPAGALLSGIAQLAALLGLWLAALVACVTLYEFYRGAQARARITGSGFWLSFAQLVLRNRRRYGGFTIHLGVVLMAFGIIGIELFQSETQATLAYGEQLSIGSYQLRYDSLVEFPASDGRVITRATLNVSRDGRLVTQLFPRRDFFTDSQQPMTIPAVYSTLADDLYVLLVGWEPAGAGGATFKVYVNPLVNWLWAGGLVFIIGTLVATWPERRELQTAAERARAMQLPVRSVTGGV